MHWLRTTLLLLLMLAGCGENDKDANYSNLDEQGNRDYSDLLNDPRLTALDVERVKRFDRWAFTNSQKFYYAPVRKRNLILKAGVLPKLRKHWSVNSQMLEHTAFHGIAWSASTLAEANLVFLGLEDDDLSKHTDIMEKFGVAASVDLLDSSSFSSLSSSGCYAERIIEGYDIIMTLVVKVGLKGDLTREQAQELVVCLNKGYYYHFGFNNVAAIPDSQFVTRYKDGQGYYLSPIDAAYAPVSFLRGNLNGETRKTVLRKLIDTARN